jgi:Domain of Unknown Function (DUF748)
MTRSNGSDWRSRLARLRGNRRLWIFVGLPLAIILSIAYVMAFLIDEPLRRYTEAKMNRALKGYTVQIKKLDFHPHGFSLDLKGLTLVQDAHPDPAVADIPYLHASVNWKALLHGRVVGDMLIDRPKVYMNLVQLRKEIADPTPVKERGWQEALEAIYPLKVNELRVREADITYQDQGPYKPLRLRNLNFVATNIRNVKSKDQVYPSAFTMDAAVFDSGHVRADGRADFLAEPNPTSMGKTTLERIELDYFKPITNRYNVSVDKGLISATGEFEFGSKVRRLELQEATIDGIKVDYMHTPQTAAVEQARVTGAVKAAKAVSNAPDLLVKIARLRITKSTFGYVNKMTSPPYRAFVSDAEVTLTNLSNQTTDGVATAKLQGKFMGSGSALVDAKFHTEKSGPAFELSVRITDVSMPAMNELFRAYGNFDVAAGEFSFFSEMAVRDGAITGYVKPLFKDMVVYDQEKDKDKTFTHKVYERVVGGVAKLLKNRPREEVATRADISGRLDNPNVKPMEVIVHLIQNAFFKAILPGLQREPKRARA